MIGKAYGVGVGPGDPELMTLKAVRLIKESRVIAVPGEDPKGSVAYRIAVQAVPELAEKTLIALPTPMTMDRAALAAAHRRSADLVEEHLRTGENVICLVLGDPTVYCSFSYIDALLKADGFETELVSGITSFCAAAARLGTSLAESRDALHIFPASQRKTLPEDLPGTWILMKSGSRMAGVKEMIASSGRDACAVENCGMEGEKVYGSLEDIPDDAGYYTLIIAKER